MSISAEVFIQCLMLIVAGLCGFCLNGLTNSEKLKLRDLAWFIAGLLMGALLTAALFAMTDYY